MWLEGKEPDELETTSGNFSGLSAVHAAGDSAERRRLSVHRR